MAQAATDAPPLPGAPAAPGGGPAGPDPGDQAKISHHAQEILKITRDTEFLQSFLRVGHGETDSEDGAKQATSGTEKGRGEERGEGDPSASGKDDAPHRPRHKATFKEVVKELELSYGLGALASKKGRRGKSVRGEEVYTDKDRAAAVQMGHRDIKQSLCMKRHQERVRALQLPEEADPSTLLALGQYELRQGHTDIAIAFVNKALQLSPDDKTALVARSKCYLLLGQPRLALQDAETALGPDRNFVRAIFQKAEALYHLGDFEHSLMYYHRGLRLRPELAIFRLGVQKAQEAIENTIGTGIEESCKIMAEAQRARSAGSGGKGSLKARMGSPSPVSSRDVSSAHRSTSPSEIGGRKSNSPSDSTWASSAGVRSATPRPGSSSNTVVTPTGVPTLSIERERSRSSRAVSRSASRSASSNGLGTSVAEQSAQSSRHLLGELCVDKLYLEQLLKHPDIKCAIRERSCHISMHAEDGVEFLRNRQEFWRQQKLSTGPGGVTTHSRSSRRPARPGTSSNASSRTLA